MKKILESPWRRGSALASALVVALGVIGTGAPVAASAQTTIKLGITLPLTGADAEDANLIKNGAMLAIMESNAKGEIPGHTLKAVILNNATATAGQYDPAQAATNARKLVSDPEVVGNIGPEMSGDGKAMSPIFSQADMATITPASTNPDITNPRFAPQFRPNGGKPVYFRTVTTDAYQGPNMANYYKEVLHVKSVYVLDDSGAYGVGLADAFEAHAKKIGIKVLGRDRLDPREADYATVLTKIKGLNPDAIFYGGVSQAGNKLIKQAYDIIPKVIKGGGDGVYGADTLSGAGFPAVEGWYCTLASPHMLNNAKLKPWVAKYEKEFKIGPNDYALTAYDGTRVMIDAIKRVLASGQPLNRANVRKAMESTHLDTLQGMVSFDKNGDLQTKVVSVFQVQHDKKYPDNDVAHQFKYIGVAPQS